MRSIFFRTLIYWFSKEGLIERREYFQKWTKFDEFLLAIAYLKGFSRNVLILLGISNISAWLIMRSNATVRIIIELRSHLPQHEFDSRFLQLMKIKAELWNRSTPPWKLFKWLILELLSPFPSKLVSKPVSKKNRAHLLYIVQ